MSKNPSIKVGLEREALRLRKDGSIDTSFHPSSLGDKLYNKYITTDFSESQLELITPVFTSNKQCLHFLEEIIAFIKHKEKNIILHNCSLPPENCFAYPAYFGPNGKEKNNYREYLVKKYPLEMQLISGIHYNFSINGLTNDQYFHIIRNTIRYGYIFPYFFGHSSNKKFPDATSIRLSSVGYFPKNQQDWFIDFSSLSSYTSSLNKQDDLYSIVEYYCFIRPKFSGNLVNYIELRSFDINPNTTCGIDLESMEFATNFLCKMLEIPSPDLNKDELKECFKLHDTICLFGKQKCHESLINDTLKKLSINAPKITTRQKARTKSSPITAKDSAVFQEEVTSSTYKALETSTQLLIKEAILQNLDIEILDATTSTIRITQASKQEVISQASITQRDSVISYRLQENKSLTKMLLQEAHLNTPSSKTFQTKHIDVSSYLNKKVCIKPVYANYGDGISIIETDKEKVIKEAIALAFTYSSEIMIEDFFYGEEYRFFVIGGKEVFVCKRIPPFVTGDGISSIKKLIDSQNEQRPLYPILYDGDCSIILEKEEVKYLRENSNVSTGGSSVDYTDSMPTYFKEIAIKAANTMGAFLCGVDIIIKDIKNINEPKKNDNYTIIETNYNPAILIHEHPYFGSKRVCRAILTSLGFSCRVN